MSTGLLVVSNVRHIRKTLRAIERNITDLYIHLNIPMTKTQPAPSWGRLISQLYIEGVSFCNTGIDMRILVGPLRNCCLTEEHLKQIDTIFADTNCPEVCELLHRFFNVKKSPVYLHKDLTNDLVNFQSFDEPCKMYKTVVLGGTFDRIHVGHKIFLTQAILRTSEKLVVGVTMENMTKSKTLPELILPVEQRMQDVRAFLLEIDPAVQYEVVAIEDPYGPTKTDSNMDLIVVSAETLDGGNKINKLREKNNLRQLDIFCINLIQNNINDEPKESKISSSNTRIELLGTRLQAKQPRPNLPNKPYIIGLTGTTASGKSIMAKYLKDLGAHVLDCDKIAHELYKPEQKTFKILVLHFGKQILNSSGFIDRVKLGDIVFNDEQQLKALNKIIWPELLSEVKTRIATLSTEEEPSIVVIEAAILLKAGWEIECHEVWSMIIPNEIAVKRIMERNKLTEVDARKRLAAQMNNVDIIRKSNVVFSSQWDTKFTKFQAEKAWHMLMLELQEIGNSALV